MATRHMRRNEPLTVEIKRGKLVIEIGVATLGKCAVHSEDLGFWDTEGGYNRPTITNAPAFADCVVESLCDEDELGATSVHRMFDKAMVHVVEWGGAGITVPERKRNGDA